MEDNLKNGVEQLMSGLDAMVKGLEETVTKSYSNMTDEQAKEFAKGMKSANVEKHIEDLKKSTIELKTSLNV